VHRRVELDELVTILVTGGSQDQTVADLRHGYTFAGPRLSAANPAAELRCYGY
jgi:hypothetical protein